MSDNQIEVDLLGSDQGLGNELSKVVAQMQQILGIATQIIPKFSEATKIMSEAPKELLKVKVALSQATEAGNTAEVERLNKLVATAERQIKEKTETVNQLRRELSANSEARAIQQDQMGGLPVRGRSVDDSRTRNAVVGAYTTSINTDDAQMVARVTAAAASAAERLIKTAEASIVARLNQVGVTEQVRRETYGTAAGANAALTRGRIAGERTLRDFGPGAPQTLSEVEAAKVASDNEKARANYQRQTAEVQNKEFDARAKAAQKAIDDRKVQQDKNLIAEAEQANRNFTARQKEDEQAREARITQRAKNERAEAEQANKNINDRIRSDAKDAEDRKTQQAKNLRSEADQANKNFDARIKDQEKAREDARKAEAKANEERATQLAKNTRAEADQANKNFDARIKDEEKTRQDRLTQLARNSRAEADQANKNVDAALKNRDLNVRYEAEGENRRVTPETAARLASRDANFANKYGIERSTFIQQTKDENRSVEVQTTLLRGLAEERKRANSVKPEKIELTPEERQARAAQRNRESNEALSDRLNDNGGATFFALQSRIAANFAIFGAAVQGIRAAASAIVEFDDVLKQFQGITDTTNKEMETFRGQLLDIASTSKFSVNEIAKVAISLGQTGLSAADVAKALKPVVDLATASGSTLQQSVEAVTSVLGAYALEAGRAGDVSDVFVGALNRTKLTMEQLQLGIQYAANIARDSGISFSELTATIGTVAQAGVKSGSTIGTGVRQLITELVSPTDKFRGVLKELGISLADVDLKTNGLTGVLENLRNKGFSTADALRSLDLRAAAAYSALSGQGDRLKTLQQELLLTSAAADASSKANESLASGFQRFQNAAFAVVDRSLSPMVEALKGATGAAAGLFGAFSQLGPILPIIGTGLASIAAAATAAKLIGLITGLAGGALVLPVLPVALGVGTLVAATAIIAKFDLMISAAEAAKKRLDELKASENDLRGAGDSITTNIGSLDTSIQTLIERREKLNSDGVLRRTAVIEAQKAFGDLGLSISGNITNIDDLVQALQRLRADMSKQLPPIFADQAAVIAKQIEQLKILQEEQAKSRRSRDEAIGGDVLTTTTRPLDKFDRFQGAGFDLARSIIETPTQLGKDAPAVAGPAFAEIVNAQNAARLAAGQAVIDGNKKEAEKQNARLALLDELANLLKEAVGTQNNINGRTMAQERAVTDAQVKTFQATPRFQSFVDQTEAAYGAKTRAQSAIRADNSLDDIQKRDKLMESSRDARDDGNRIMSFFNDFLDEMVKSGTSKEVAEQAGAALKNKISEVTKVVTDPVRQTFDAVEVGAKALYEAQKRIQQRTIDNALKTANTTQNPEEVRVQEEIIADAVKKQSEILRKLADLKKANPESLDLDPIARQQLAADEEALRDTAEGYSLRIGEIKKRIAKQLLDYRDQADDAQKARLTKEADRLTKELNLPGTTEEKARELVAAITNLLTQATEIVKRQNMTDLERKLIQAPADAVLPDASGRATAGGKAPDGSTAKAIIDAANANGASAGMTRYLLALAQLESSQDPMRTNPSGAKGLLQFMDTEKTPTWARSGGGNIFSIQDQIRNGITFTGRNDAEFQRQMGRAPTDEERFVLHNQGAGGGLGLLNNPNGRAVDQVSAAAITGNAGNTSMTSAEFVEVLKGMYRRASGATEGQATSVKTVLERAAGDKDAAADEELQKKQEDGAKRIAEIKRNSEMATLKALDKEQNTRLQGEENLVKRSVTPESAQEASSKTLTTIAELRANALKEAALDPKNRDPEQKAASTEAIGNQFRERAQTDAVVAAETVGKLTLKIYDDQINSITARLKELDKDKADGKYDADTYNSLKQQLETLTETKNLKGQIAAYDAEIKTLNDSITQLENSGVGERKDMVRITDQILELEKKRAALAPGLAAQEKIKATAPSIDNSFSQGTDDFLKSRGIEDSFGRLTTAASQTRKAVTADLQVLANGFDTLFTDLATGSISATDALKKFAQSILTGLLQQASKALTNSIFAGLFGGASGSGGAGGGSLFSSIGSFFGDFGKGGFSGLANGGAIPGMATGGEVDGGSPNRDSVLRRLMPGEFVMRRSAVSAVGKDNLSAINALGNSVQSRAPKMNLAGLGSSAQANANVYVMAPEQKPIPGKNDIVYMIADDMQTGGQLRRLVKSISAGHDG